MKKLILFMFSLLFTISLTSCGYSTSYKKLSKIDSEIDENYIAFGENDIVINGDYNKITYTELIDTYHPDIIKKEGNDIILSNLHTNHFCRTKYHLDSGEYDKEDIELVINENWLSNIYDFNNNYIIISYGNDFKDIGHVIDNDLNVYSVQLSNEENNISVCYGDYGIVFFEFTDKEYEDNEYIKRGYNTLKGLSVFKNNEFLNFKFEKDIYFENIARGMTNYENDSKSALIIDNYFVLISDNEPTFIFDLESNEILYYISAKRIDVINYYNSNEKTYYDNIRKIDRDLLDYISNEIYKINNPTSIYDEVPHFKDVKTNKKFKKIISTYCTGTVSVRFTNVKKDDDGNYYYIVYTEVDVRYMPWLLRGDTDSHALDPAYIFRYNKEDNDLTYVGYSKGNLKCFFIY